MAQKNKDARMRFASNVERLRRQHGYSVARLSERSEIDLGEIEAILRGDAEADVDSIYRLAGALDVTPGELHEGVTWIPDGEGGGEFQVDDRPPEG
jgi:transcriptional regulator with XRE-family HTH domain